MTAILVVCLVGCSGKSQERPAPAPEAGPVLATHPSQSANPRYADCVEETRRIVEHCSPEVKERFEYCLSDSRRWADMMCKDFATEASTGRPLPANSPACVEGWIISNSKDCCKAPPASECE